MRHPVGHEVRKKRHAFSCVARTAGTKRQAELICCAPSTHFLPQKSTLPSMYSDDTSDSFSPLRASVVGPTCLIAFWPFVVSSFRLSIARPRPLARDQIASLYFSGRPSVKRKCDRTIVQSVESLPFSSLTGGDCVRYYVQ